MIFYCLGILVRLWVAKNKQAQKRMKSAQLNAKVTRKQCRCETGFGYR